MKLASVALAFSCALVSAEPPASGGALLWKTPSKPIPPTKDDFYTQPHDFQTALPGTVLRYRVAPGNITALFPAASKMYNILYRTSDALDRFSWAVTTLMVPENPYKAGAAEQADSCERQGTALLSYQLAYDSCALDSSPSYSLYAKSAVPSEKDITSALELGWFVSVPDYEGPLASFGSGVQAGHGTLDAVRAVLSLARDNAEIGLSPDAKSTLWGYSGGSVASEWAVELQGSYAPDLQLSGTVLGGVVANFETALHYLSGSPFAQDTVAALLGLTSQFPYQREFLVSNLKKSGPYNATTFLAALHLSFDESLTIFENQTIADYFVHGNADILAPIMRSILEPQGTMGNHGLPRMPMFVYKAIADELSPVNETDALINKFCNFGANILYERNKIGNHLTEYANGHTRALNWLSSIFNGTYGHIYESHGCTIKNVSVVDPTGPQI